MSRSRSYVFTVNNYTSSDMAGIILMSEYARYIIIGFEVGENGTPHIQGYVYFDEAKTRTTLSKKWLQRAWMEAARGNAESNFDYNTKQGDVWEFGDIPDQGKLAREKIEEVMNNPLENFHLYNQYNKSYNKLIKEERIKNIGDLHLEIINSEDMFKVANSQDGTVYLDVDWNAYDGEDVLMIPAYSSFPVINWYNKYYPRIVRGYEIIKVCPSKVYITYSDAKEKNYLIKKYIDIVDEVS